VRITIGTAEQNRILLDALRSVIASMDQAAVIPSFTSGVV
jgi:hypothetical protein